MKSLQPNTLLGISRYTVLLDFSRRIRIVVELHDTGREKHTLPLISMVLLANESISPSSENEQIVTSLFPSEHLDVSARSIDTPSLFGTSKKKVQERSNKKEMRRVARTEALQMSSGSTLSAPYPVLDFFVDSIHSPLCALPH